MNQLTQPDAWRRQLGYLPVPLFGAAKEQSFVMLNGSKGNFLLDVGDNSVDPAVAAQRAWSADVDHYLAVRGNNLSLLRWDQAADWSEHFKAADIASKLILFQQYIESKQAPRERSVVSRAVSIYRAVRARAQGNSDRKAMLAFMAVLNTAWKQQERRSQLEEHWLEAEEAEEAARSIFGSEGTEVVLSQLLKHDFSNRKPPDVRLMVRHASGRIFQEAHYLALAPLQSDMFFGGQVKISGPSSKTLGAFFTPTPLVRTLAEQSLNRLNLAEIQHIHVFDPACGSGEFLREAIRQLSLRGFKGRVTVTGYDISPPACLMARFGLAAEAATFKGRLSFSIEQRDAFDGKPWVKGVNLCLMNPPFVAWPDMNALQQETVSTVLGELQVRRPDLASAFVRLAVDSLLPSGVIGAVLPASFLDGNSSALMREFLLSKTVVELSARLGNQAVFSDVTVDPALLILKRQGEQPSTDATVLVWADHASGSSDQALRALRRHDVPQASTCLENQRNFSIYSVPTLGEAIDWAPRPYSSAQVLSKISNATRVGERFSVQQGAITGLNAAFILDEEEYQALSKVEQRFFRPAVVNESIRNGLVSLGTWVFYPHDEGLPALITEEDVQKRLPRYYKTKLLPYKEALILRARITDKNWWKLSEHRSWLVSRRPKIISTYFGAAGSFALDRDGDLVVVQGYGWQPKREGLTERHLLAIVATLNAKITNTLLAGISNNLSGGQWNLSKRFIERMPIIEAQSLPAMLLESLSQIGEQMTRGGDWDSDVLNQLTCNALGLSFPSA